MHVFDQRGYALNESIGTDVTNFKKRLAKEYNLRKLPKKRGVSSVDDLYYILFHHWVYDDTIYADEQQRIYVAAGLLMASYFGCRPVSMFDTRVKLLSYDSSGNLSNEKIMKEQAKSMHNEDSDGTTLISSNSGSENDVSTHFGSDGGTDSNSESDSNSQSDSGTDDDVNAGTDNTRSLLWRHITFFVLPNRVSGMPNILFAKVTIMHTKGEDNCPRQKTFIVEQEDNPLLCLLDHLLTMAYFDNVFMAESLKNVFNLFCCKMPPGKKSLRLAIKADMLDIPVFREPGRSRDGYRTSSTQPLRASTWLRYLKQLGLKSGLEQPLTQYCARRGLVNAINNQAPPSVRDQIFDHHSQAVRYYLDQEVRFNTQAAFLGRPSDEIVQKLARLMTLTVDPKAPTKLSKEQSKKVTASKSVVALRRRSQELKRKLRHDHHFIKAAPIDDPDRLEKKEVDATIRRLVANRRNRLLTKTRKRHFRSADTANLDAQFANPSAEESDETPAAPMQYDLPERAQVVQLTCESVDNLTDLEKHARRIEAIRARAALCARQESRNRRQPPIREESPDELTNDQTLRSQPECVRTQCIFCLGDERKSSEGRTFEYSRPAKMMDAVETHLQGFSSSDSILCPHPYCKPQRLVLTNTIAFKAHVEKEHKIKLRDPARC